MLRTAVVASAILLAGCEQKTWTRSEITDIAEDQADGSATRVASRVDDLETRVDELESRLGMQAAAQAAVADKAANIAARVDNNARIANDNILRDATAAGDCGTESYWESPGIFRNRKITCTAETYFKRR